MKPLMINATDRNTINHDNYQFYFNKLLTSKRIKIQNDVLTKELIKADGFRLISTILSIIGTCFMIYNYMSPDTTVKTAGHMATSASNMLSRANTLVSFGYREDQGNISTDLEQRIFTPNEVVLSIKTVTPIETVSPIKTVTPVVKIQEEYIDEQMGTLNRNGGRYLSKQYENNEEFRNEVSFFLRDKKELDLEAILDRRYKTNTLNMTRKKYLAKSITSKDNTKDVIEILAKYVEYI